MKGLMSSAHTTTQNKQPLETYKQHELKLNIKTIKHEKKVIIKVSSTRRWKLWKIIQHCAKYEVPGEGKDQNCTTKHPKFKFKINQVLYASSCCDVSL